MNLQNKGIEDISLSYILLLIIGVTGIVGWLLPTLTKVPISLAGAVGKVISKT